ncbi:hypothetical protein CI610_03616 [invertebrate metagenome]|uniref:Uncharacterized protein n=1 Tax=invertebrate metagenome TaxID=1711999 RepID=A0A2H9T2L7_9ZZZZ
MPDPASDLPDPASDFPDPTSDLLDPASDLPDPAFDNGRATIFNRAQTLMILLLYLERKHKFGSVVYKKKTLWFEITEKLNTHFKTTFTAGQVEGRWKTQLAAYRQYKDDQNKSGNSRKEFPDEAEFTEILGDRHDLEPAYKLQSMPAKESVGSQNSSGEGKRKASNDGNSCEKKKTKPRTSTTNDTITFLKSYVESQNENNKTKAEALEKRHNEKMGVLQEMLKAMKDQQ